MLAIPFQIAQLVHPDYSTPTPIMSQALCALTTLLCRANIYVERRDADQAFDFADQAEILILKKYPDDTLNYLSVIICIYKYHVLKGTDKNCDKILKAFAALSAYCFNKEIDNKINQLLGMLNLQPQDKLAHVKFSDEERQNWILKITALIGVALLYFWHIKNYDATELCIDIFGAIRNDYPQLNYFDLDKIYNNIAVIYSEKKEFDKAEKYAMKALEVIDVLTGQHQSQSSRQMAAITKFNLSQIRWELKRETAEVKQGLLESIQSMQFDEGQNNLSLKDSLTGIIYLVAFLIDSHEQDEAKIWLNILTGAQLSEFKSVEAINAIDRFHKYVEKYQSDPSVVEMIKDVDCLKTNLVNCSPKPDRELSR